jgi:hydrogenase maturation factor
VSEEKAQILVTRLREKGIDEAAVIGEVVADPQEKINVSRITGKD